MKKITLVFAMSIALLGFSQNLPIDFEDGTSTVSFSFNGVVVSNVDNPDVNNNSSSRVLRVEKGTTTDGGNPAAWFAGFGFQNPGGGTWIDLSNGTAITLKMWSSRANVPVRARLQNSTNSAPAYNVDFVIGAANTWEDITLDFAAANAAINGSETYAELVLQPNFDPACEAPGASCVVATDDLFYFDDIEQPSTVDPVADASLSDLTVDGTTIAGFTPNILTYAVQLPNGATTVPVVDATATQSGTGSSNVVITQATSITGTATVDVTAPDGSTTRAYTVNFSEATIAPSGISPQSGSNGTDLYVYSDLGDASNTVSNFQINQFGNGTRGEVDLDGDSTNETFRLENVGFYGAGWDVVDLTVLPYTFVHINYFAESTDEFKFFIIDSNSGIGGGAPEEPRYTVNNSGTGEATLNQGSWESLFMPLSFFENFDTGTFTYDLEAVGQYKIETSGGILFFDNIFFSTDNTLSNRTIAIESLLVSPNPSTGIWNFNDPVNEIIKINLFDITGKLIIETTPQANAAQLDGSALNSGIYLANVVTELGSQTVKLIKN